MSRINNIRINSIRINNIKQRLHWLRRGLNSVLFERPMPSAMVSWRLLLPTADPCIRAHRAFWRHATSPRLPLPVAIAIESFLWLRWVCWYAWLSTRAWVRERGPDVVASGGPGYWQQYLCVLRLAVLHTIHPSDTYAFQLIRKDQRQQLWRYVYSHETQAYHQWRSLQLRSAGRADWLAATALLSDKVALTQHLRQLGLPAAEILEIVPPGGRPDFARWLARYPALFCKTRRGARAEGAFAVEPSDNAAGFSLKMFRGNQSGKADTASQLQALLDNSEYLIQPRLENHPRLAALSAPGDLVELRVVTECEHGQVTVRTAYLYSVARDASDEWALLLFPVTLEGAVLAAPEHDVAPRFREQANTVLAALGDQPLPDWAEITAALLKAHQGVLCGAATIAWDIVITPDGPRILEGNPGWGVAQPQMLSGPFLPAV